MTEYEGGGPCCVGRHLYLTLYSAASQVLPRGFVNAAV